MIAGGTLWGTKIALLISILKVKRFSLIDMCLLLWGPTLMLTRMDVFYASFKLITKYTTHKKGPRRSL
jgi:hypothetical protein